MPRFDWLILLGIGILLILLGIGALYWGKKEEKSYYNTIASRPDVREFMERLPWRPEPGSLKIGGRISVLVGILMLIAGVVLWLVRLVS